MEKKRVLIVEDNIVSMKMLEKLVGEINNSIICYTASNLKEAYIILHNVHIDLFLLDIILEAGNNEDLSGIRLAEEIRSIDRYLFTPIIFITSVEDPRMFAYEYLHSYGYIEKPYHVESTKKLIRKALEYRNVKDEDRVICLRGDGILYPVKEKDIIFIESKGHVLTVYTRLEKIKFSYKTCGGVMSLLDEDFFVQCSRCSIVNVKYISNIDMVNGYAALNSESEIRSIKVGKKYIKHLIDEIVKAKTECMNSVH